MSSLGRFTAWFSATERRALEAVAEKERCTVNYIIRTAIRQYVGSDALKTAARGILDESEEVVPVTGNK